MGNQYTPTGKGRLLKTNVGISPGDQFLELVCKQTRRSEEVWTRTTQ